MKKEINAPTEVVANFDNWQSPRRGAANPENQTNVVWSWLAKTRAWPKAAQEAAGAGEKKSPGWCFDRFGQSETELADGSVVYIGGEHEDHYDPDFFIYNDVVVLRPDGSSEFYGYPTEVFPPADFHSATLFGDEIFIVGGLRYPDERDQSDTLVFRLQLSDFSIHLVESCGNAPSWLYDHTAELDNARQTIVCSGGQVTHEPTGRTVENLTTWEFDLSTNTWSSLETKPFQRWILVREDEGYNELWGIEQVARASQSTRIDDFAEKYRTDFAARGHEVDAELFEARFTPPLPHTPIEATDRYGDDYRVHRFLVEGVVVRIFEDMHEIVVNVEGELSPDLLASLERFGLETYSAIEGVPYKSIRL
ncbi:hypothetical protein HCZ23_04805 [Celeribacter sp. HF31]|uniref:hypothetical protein n=1 Tax=Celeribacter sp. HF31 TaxID=2721558 RepID=UPI001430FBE7|nr:hypothetical protein [Celeribacter sp. HF31]NIY78782.1 hypothetical protein [Celeribacter sp. HF31]